MDDPNGLLLLPLLLVFIVASATQRIAVALFLGCSAAAFVVSQGATLAGCQLLLVQLMETTQLASCSSWELFLEASNLQISLFLAFMGILVVAIEESGSYRRFNELLVQQVRSRRHAEAAAATFTQCLAIDGYLATLTAGAAIRPLFDQLTLARIKLAYIARCSSLATCSINPISTWVALLLFQLHMSGITRTASSQTLVLADPFLIYVGLLPFAFYALLSLLVLWTIIFSGSSFGYMRFYERGLNSSSTLCHDPTSSRAHAITPHLMDLLLPLGTMMGFTALALFYTGGWSLLGGTHSFLESLHHLDGAASLFLGSLGALLVYWVYLMARRLISWRDLGRLSWRGGRLMASSILVLNLVWTLIALEMYDGGLPNLVANTIPNLFPAFLLPFAFFLVALFFAGTIGSSWATMTLLFPLATSSVVAFAGADVPLSLEQVPLLLPTLAAVVSGAVSGDQLSPLSDLNLVVCATVSCSQKEHTTSQLSYSLPVVLATALAYLISGGLASHSLWLASSVSIGTAIAFLLAYLLFRHRRSQTQPIKTD